MRRGHSLVQAWTMPVGCEYEKPWAAPPSGKHANKAIKASARALDMFTALSPA
jgi:hypothetical protein